MKIGMIGLGTMAQCHFSGLRNLNDVEIVALCDKNEEHARKRASEWNVPRYFTDYNELLAIPDIDAVTVVTPNCMHAPIVIAALNAGKHVLCEKPPAMNEAEARDMQQCAEKNKRVLMYGLQLRFTEKINMVRDMRKKGRFGDIYFAKTQYIRRCGNPGGWFSDKSQSGGGPLIDLGVHTIDGCIYLMGDDINPVSVYAVTYSKMGNRAHIKGYDWYRSTSFGLTSVNDVEDMAVAMIRFDNGATLQVEVSYVSNIATAELDFITIDLLGDKGGVRVEPGLEIYGEMDDYLVDIRPILTDSSIDWDKGVELEAEHFVQCIKDGITCRSSAKDGVKIMRILDAIYASAEQGISITL